MMTPQTAAFAPVTSQELDAPKSQEVEVTRIRKDRDRLDWLLKVSTEYVRQLQIDMDYCEHLTKYKQVVYLFDFDVLRQYLEGSDPGSDREVIDPQSDQNYAVFRLILESKWDYAFPQGACIELFHWLKKEIYPARTIELLENLNKQQFLMRCAQLLQIENAEALDEAETLDEIAGRIEKKAQVVDRLIRVLDSDRFKGMVSYSDANVRRVIKDILVSIPRSGRRGRREELDDCDAMNLSIAIESVRGAIAAQRQNTAVPSTIHLLVSQTSAVFQVARHLGDLKEVPNFVREFEDFLRCTPKETTAFLPVMSPRHAFRLIEVFDLFGNPLGAYNSIAYLSRQFNDASQQFRNARAMIEFWDKEENKRSRVMDDDIRTNIRLALDNLKGVGEKMLFNDPHLSQIEQERAQAISDHYARKVMEGQKARSREERVRQNSVSFMKLLSRLLISLNQTNVVSYRCDLEPRQSGKPFQRLSIAQVMEGVGDKPEEVATGEIYYHAGETGGQPLYYALRWPIACLEDDFLASLKKLLIPIHSAHSGLREKHINLPLEIVTDESTYWDEGLMIYTTQGVFGCPLASFFASKAGWFQLRYRQLYDQFNKSRALAGKNLQASESARPFMLLQYRVNSHYGDFLFDIEPAEDDANRYLTVVSDYNLSQHIIAMFNYTGMQCVIPKKLEQELSAKLSAFPQFA